MGRRWTEDEDALAADTSLTLQQVADLTGRTYAAVAHRASGRGVRRSSWGPGVCRPDRWTEEEDAIVADTSLTLAAVAELTGRSIAAVEHRARELGAYRRPPWTEEEVEILHDTSLSLRPTADRTGRSVGAVAVAAHHRGVVRGPRKARWTPEEDALVRDTSLSLQDVADMTGRTLSAATGRAFRLGISRPLGRPPKTCRAPSPRPPRGLRWVSGGDVSDPTTADREPTGHGSTRPGEQTTEADTCDSC